MLLNQADGTFAAAVAYAAGHGSTSVAIGDLDGVNGPDLAVVNVFSDDVSVLLNQGDGTFAAAVHYDAGSFPSSVAVGDLDGVNGPDLAVANFNSNDVSVLLNLCTVAALDFKPGSCPNPLNRNSHGVLPVALVGSADFNVLDVDLNSIVMTRADGVGGEVAPHVGPPGPHSVIEDVATPFDGEPCDCHEVGGDGIPDLSVKFSTQALLDDLEAADARGEIELVLSGNLLDGTPFTASDCVRLVPLGDMDGDGSVNVPDLLALLAAWGTDPGGPPDFDGSGNVAVPDLLILLGNWG